MTTLESDSVHISKTPEDLTTFLGDINHIGTLMPPQVENWTSDGDTCRFRIQGMADIGMKVTAREPGKLVRFESDGKVPFPFTLSCHVSPAGDGQSALQLKMDAAMNPMLKVMAATPLRNFLNLLAEKCAELA